MMGRYDGGATAFSGEGRSLILLWVLVRALLVCFGASLAAVLLSLAGWWTVAIFISLGFGYLAMSVGEGWLHHRRRSTSIAAFGGLVIVVGASIMSLGSVEQRLWPGRASGLTLEEAHADAWSTTFAFRSGRPRPELGGKAPVLGRFGTAVDTVSVVPVVEESWTAAEPIAVWAVARKATLPERSRLWEQPIRIGVRVSGFYLSDYQEAAARACRTHRLRSSQEPLFIEWTPAPDASLIAAWRSLGAIVLVAALALFGLNLLMKVFQWR
jgi:hypothetical protein